MIDEDCLQLTTYFGERDRRGGRLVADELLDTYARHGLRTSILVRGSAGFGGPHHLRTDHLLSLSEDLPVIAIAVDRRDRIEAAIDDVAEIGQRGLITLERTRVSDGELGAVELPEALHATTKLTIYIGRRERVGRTPVYVAICRLLHRYGIAGATVLLGVDGTRESRRNRARFIGRNAEVPMIIVAVGGGAEIARVLPELGDLLRHPTITLEPVRLCKRDGQLIAAPHELPATDADGLGAWQKLTVYTSQAATYEGRPLELEIIRRLRASDAAGATSVRGIWGFHGDHPPHGDRFLQVRRHVPVVTISIDVPERTAQAFHIIDELTQEQGLVTAEMVPAAAAPSAERPTRGLKLSRIGL